MKTRPAFFAAAVLAVGLLLVAKTYWIETEPPTLTVTAPPGARVAPGHVVEARAEDSGLGISEVHGLLDGELVAVRGGEGAWSVTLPKGLKDGRHSLVLVARDRSWNLNEAQVLVEFEMDGSPPRFRLAPSVSAAQGRALKVVLGVDEPATGVEATAFGRPLPLVERDGLWIGVTGAGVSEEDGELVITATDVLGNRGERRLPLPVATTEFAGGGVVKLDAKRQKNQKDDGLRAQDREKRKVAYAIPQADWLITGLGRLPTEGIVSSPFGKVRRYNTGVVRHHLGTDIAVAQGTPVRASGDGVVALAELLPIHGNAVVLRHGPSLSTSYNHLHTIDVAVGERVGKGEVVGTVGSTGQSTGPHLHWGMVAGGVAVAAETWLEVDLLTPSPEDRAALEAEWPAP